MQSQNATASHQQPGISSLAVTLCPALPTRAKTHPIPKQFCRKIGHISSKISRIVAHCTYILSHRRPLYVHPLESKGRTGTHPIEEDLSLWTL